MGRIKKVIEYIKPNRECYNSYFYLPEDEDTTILDQFDLQGIGSENLDGGSANHVNLGEYPTPEGFRKLIKVAIKTKCEYFCFNILNTCCNNCGYIDKRKQNKCIKCGSSNIDYATRIIGYLTRISAWSVGRQQEHQKRMYKMLKIYNK